jgi:hypothetical protein
MARLVVLWTRPYHLSTEEADAWIRREVARVLECAGIARGELTRLQSASPQHPSAGDWMLELHLREGVDAASCLESSACADWLRDLRLLGMRPAVVLVEGSTTMTRTAP